MTIPQPGLQHSTSVQFSRSVVSNSVTPWTSAHQASLSITNSKTLLKLMSIESAMPSNHLILCRPLLLSPSIFPSTRVFSNESALWIRWPKYGSFSFSISPSNEHSGLISFRMGWLDLLAVQGTLKSLLQHHSSKASILQCSAFFIVQLSHPYMYITQYINWLYMTSRQTYLFTVSWTNHAVSQLTTAPTALPSSPASTLSSQPSSCVTCRPAYNSSLGLVVHSSL